ncbi:hypothetical protein EVAR_101702_1 [Eumeta japonica]|uniref:Uncharacterized protein n=1 Tax=Eumeta variegata TaxID=151549 RepID=A0A4C1TAD4_EUMVA|nr:hypothetical protein EVAR_101702_1 [Eumeta japonica]
MYQNEWIYRISTNSLTGDQWAKAINAAPLRNRQLLLAYRRHRRIIVCAVTGSSGAHLRCSLNKSGVTTELDYRPLHLTGCRCLRSPPPFPAGRGREGCDSGPRGPETPGRDTSVDATAATATIDPLYLPTANLLDDNTINHTPHGLLVDI